MNGNHHDDFEDVPAPARLVAALVALRKERIFVPSQVDDAILARAQAQLGASPQAGGWKSGFLPWLAAAALVLGIWVSWTVMRQPGRTAASFAREDINHDGRVDILDAFALARKLEHGQLQGVPDFNGDGRVDQQDVDRVAAQAVKLEKGS